MTNFTPSSYAPELSPDEEASLVARSPDAPEAVHALTAALAEVTPAKTPHPGPTQ